MSRATDIIEAGGILLCERSTTFEDAVRLLIDNLVERELLSPRLRDEAVTAVCERERLASTAMVEIGVSIPHARVEGIQGVIGALAASPSAVYHAMAGVPISIVAVILSAPNSAGEHLNVLASLSLLLQSQAVRRGIEQAGDAAAALAVLRAQGSPVL
jgi:mannitol/fructose-specific phosphotransferase system IIA component (Ntr-type)